MTTTQQQTNVDPTIEKFIINFTNHSNDEQQQQTIQTLFTQGYCWHFAQLLKATFNRGSVCWVAPNAHFVWVDTSGQAYDINGAFDLKHNEEPILLIPVHYLGDAILDFKQLPNQQFNATKQDIDKIIEDYQKKERT